MRAKLVIVRRRDQRVDQTPPVVGFPREKKGHALCAFSIALYKSAVVKRIRIYWILFEKKIEKKGTIEKRKYD